jgi:hypothetical protein
MSNPEFFDDPSGVTCAIDERGQVNVHSLTWRGERYAIVATGRQWDEADGRYVLAEASDGTRFEAHLRREDFAWRVTKVWRAVMWA